MVGSYARGVRFMPGGLMNPFYLTVLGPPELRGPNGDPIRFRTRKHLALLVFLAVEKSFPHRRDRLASLLWPKVGIDEGRHSLATGLSVLRSRLGADAFESGRDTVRLIHGRVVTDLLALEAGIDSKPTAPLPRLFLEDFEAGEVPEFQMWCDARRAENMPRIEAAFIARIADCRRRGDAHSMEQLALHLQKVDSLNEAGARAHLEARTMLGDRIGALRLYDRWRTSLAEELGATPTRQFERLVGRLRLDAITMEVPESFRVQHPETTPGLADAFVGRAEEFKVCHECWEQTLTRQPRHLMVCGETGIGKSAFAARAIKAISLTGAYAVSIRCHPVEQLLSYGTAEELIASLLRLPGAKATPPEHLSILSRMLPAATAACPALVVEQDSTCDVGPLRLVEATLALIDAVAAEQPLVIFIDDVHFADNSSRSVLHVLLRRLTDTPVMVIMTHCDSGRARIPELGFWTSSMADTHLHMLSLGPLPVEDAEACVRLSIAGSHGIHDSALHAILAGASGNPMAMKALALDWRQNGDSSIALSMCSMRSTRTSHLSDSYSRLVDSEVLSLDQDSLTFVQLAAVLNERMNDLTMYDLAQLPFSVIMRAMAVLTSLGILQKVGDRVVFKNQFVRERCYASIAGPVRKRLHCLVADRLIDNDECGGPSNRLDIAWHLIRANRFSDALPYLLDGGARSIRMGTPRVTDWALSTGLPAILESKECSAVLTLAEAKQEMGCWAESLRVLDDCQADLNGSANQRCVLLRALNERFLGYLVGSRLQETIDAVLNIAANEKEEIEIRAKAISISAALISSSREPHHIRRLGNISATMMTIAMAEYDSIHVIHGHAWYLAQQGGPGAALPVLLAGAALVERTSTASSIAARLLLGAGVSLCQLGRYADASPILSNAYSVAKGLGNPALVANAASGLALVHGRLGNIQDQIDRACEAIHASGPEEWGICLLSAAYERGLGLAASGRAAEAENAMGDFDSRFDRRGPPGCNRHGSYAGLTS